MLMFKLRAGIIKELRILIRDKAALAVMFLMPVLLVVVITSVQHSSWKMINDNTVPLLLCNRDTGECGKQFSDALRKIGIFEITETSSVINEAQLTDSMHQRDALLAIIIPAKFSIAMQQNAKRIAVQSLAAFGLYVSESSDSAKPEIKIPPLTLFYNPVLQDAFRLSVQGAMQSAQQFTEHQQILHSLYASLGSKQIPDSVKNELNNLQTNIIQIPAAKDGSRSVPNATQHNVPAWTIFAMFFIVVSLSVNVVKEKINGSFTRLKTLPTNFLLILIAKQVAYLLVTLAQVIIIFSIGIFLFPHIGLPKLVLPQHIFGLLLVCILCGWCAVSYGIFLGVFSKTIEQAIGIGSVSVVILAAIGGIIVPAFAMPQSLHLLMMSSPLHWCMEAFNVIFLTSGNAPDVLRSALPLFVIIITLQLFSHIKLKRQYLI